jgi:hypothetical protein
MSFIVITSINEPTKAVVCFSQLNNHQVVIVGDRKSPENWHCEGTVFLSVHNQKQIGKYLNKVLPYNHYCRKMMGYLYALGKCEAVDQIIDTDDDNIPKSDWAFPEFEGTYKAVGENQGFVNIYQYFTDQKIWPRGMPLKYINRDYRFEDNIKWNLCKIGIWQGLADDDPDVDAIYRLVDDRPCFFEEREPVVLQPGTLCPFNTQNTIIRKELFPLLYLPTHVTFRFTDILRGLVAQPIMWLYGYCLGFTGATVIQARNPHDYFEDFISEIPMYQFGEKAVELTIKAIDKNNTVAENLFLAYEALLNDGIVIKKELDVLSAWLKDLEKAQEINKA